MEGTKDSAQIFSEVVASLSQGVEEFIKSIEGNPKTKELVAEIRRSQPFLTQLQEWATSLPDDRFRTALMSLVGTLDESILKAVRTGWLSPSTYGANEEFPSPSFIVDAVTITGPEIMVSQDRMQATVLLGKEFKHVWTAERIKAGLERQGIVAGISDEKVLKLVQANPDTPV